MARGSVGPRQTRNISSTSLNIQTGKNNPADFRSAPKGTKVAITNGNLEPRETSMTRDKRSIPNLDLQKSSRRFEKPLHRIIYNFPVNDIQSSPSLSIKGKRS